MKRRIIIILAIVLLYCLPALLLHAHAAQPSNKTKTTVYVFLSENCPICGSYTLTLKELYTKYHSDSLSFVGVFPNYYASTEGINEFKKKYSIPFELIRDSLSAITAHFKAEITPEVFVENCSGKVVYSGRIDDLFFKIGKRKNVITSPDLENALKEIKSGKPVTTSKTQAVGCKITLTQ